ncbi:alpha/beta hydrolase [Streptomyces sp. H10-C2]|uniref:alpha/beta fold hydrolase n=1 Tax=unclassified Streptomyces TaxID=2593676 RepID=UPI0024B93FB4|nr:MULTISPECIES: alpha/beta hydrolase [unclassified Streptomyces]MDJ0343044.1 alpha/beta hydrolase [Streptomyces sp. PH10-H1]MDJ0372776.1 alpha/beta hydrolase [Streptomyces sp. H10-C2]
MTTVANWGGTSRFADLGGPVHWVDFGGPEDAPRAVLVHGLGGSHLNWCLLAPKLAGRVRVAAMDLAGFGLTHPEGRGTTVQDNVALLDRFLREVIGEPALLVGNSMGGMISILQASARPETVTGLILVDPALPLPFGARPDPLVLSTFMLYAVPGLGERLLARLRTGRTARQQVRRLLSLVCADPSGIPEDLILASVGMVERRAEVPGLDAAFLAAARSLVLVNARRATYWSAMRALRMPVFLMSGEQDRLVPVRSARAAAARNPHWRFETFPGVGHVPQLEIPDVVAERMLDWLDRLDEAHAAGEPTH